MRQAIETKFLGPTNFRGPRVKASAEAGTVTVDWDHALDIEQNHELAARKLADRFDWLERARLEGGSLAGRGYCFVLIPNKGGSRES